MQVAVVGLGKIGLPLAVQYATSGLTTVGVDINPSVVADINAGREPFPGEFDLENRLAKAVSGGTLRATVEAADAVRDADVIVIVVPLLTDPITAEPDFRVMDAATTAVGAALKPGALVIYETTLPVGTTRKRWLPRLEALSGGREGTDFHLVYSPERVLTGRVFQDLRRYPKLIGALSEAGRDRATAFYEAALQFDERPDLDEPNGVWNLGQPEAAELAKLAETTYRDVNIALANEFARHAATVGVDIGAVIRASNSQPYSHIHRPGIAVGGHCIPVYPKLYLHGDPNAEVVRTARALNESMPTYAIDLLDQALDGGISGAVVVVMGAAYRGGVKETAVSGVFPLVREISARGGIPVVHDPMYTDAELEGLGFVPHALGGAVDAVVVHTDHAEYTTLSAADFPGAKVVVDGRAITKPEAWVGVRRIVLGDGTTS